MDALKPVDYDNLLQSADLLENFQTYWSGCENVEFPREARKQLLAKIIDRVYVYDKEVVAITLHGHYSIVLNDSRFSHHEVLQGLKGQKKRTRIAPSSFVRNGNDGDRTRDLRLDRPAC